MPWMLVLLSLTELAGEWMLPHQVIQHTVLAGAA
jgi:hypothetical protein